MLGIIEMFEHMKNYGKLLEKISRWLKDDGKLFVHIFSHRTLAYHFERGKRNIRESSPILCCNSSYSGWMARTFFTGGTMPSHDLLLRFPEHLQIEDSWLVNGKHYSRTLDAWLQRHDDNYAAIRPILDKTYGAYRMEHVDRWVETKIVAGENQGLRWFTNWRIFYIVCSETFAFNDGNEWTVSHYLFKKA